VRAENVDQPLVLRAAFGQSLELVAARSERAGRRVLERGDRARRLATRVDQILGQRADDAVASGIDLADPRLVLARGLDDAGGACVDDGGDAARLGVERVALGHGRRIL
jgi:hypothetical protein